ncbi:MAG TPA: amidohydrolase family protein [Prosthecobacter sp.]|nr:amidohydrolase family protein [Prosthecobacter sp.]
MKPKQQTAEVFRLGYVQAVTLTGLFLASLGRAELPGPSGEPPIQVIDVHTHVFNGHDLPLAGLLNALGAPLGVSGALAKVFNAITPTDDLDGPMPDAAFFTAATSQNIGNLLLKNAQSNTGDSELESLFSILPPDERDELLEFVGKSNEPELNALDDLNGVEREVEILARALAMIGFPPSDAVEPELNFAVTKASIPGYLSFLGVMMHGNLHIARKLESKEYPAVDLFIHHMMDMEKSYAIKPVVPFSKQMGRMTKLDRRFDGKFLHFVAFDPFRGEDALPSVIRGIKAGAIGVKFYPPSGYRAANNKIPEKPSRLKPGSRKRWISRYENLGNEDINKVNEKLFAYCEVNDIPIFTHCTPKGFEADKGYGEMADPQYWEIVLKKHDKLRLCFGHAGGHTFWFPPAQPTLAEKAEADFGAQVVKLCLNHPNVYCEVAYLDQILTDEGKKAFKSKLASIINDKSTKGDWRFGDKIMYGSDWHMIHKEPHHEDYPAAFNKIFTDPALPVLKPWQRSFFSRNALAYLQFQKIVSAPGVTPEQRKYWQDLLVKAAAGPKSGPDNP